MLDPLSFKQPLRLDIGAGGFSNHPDFTSVDLFTEANIKATMWEIPLPDECVDEIVSSNALEHISKHKVVPTLKEWHRLLKPGGKLRLLVPDLEWAVTYWLNYQRTDWPMDIIYGHQAHDGEYHKTGFTPTILGNYLADSAPLGWKINSMEYMFGDQQFEQIDESTWKEHVWQRVIAVDADKL